MANAPRLPEPQAGVVAKSPRLPEPQAGGLANAYRLPRRTTLEIDDALLGQAQKALDTKGLKETVDKAFREAIRRYLRERLAERISTGAGIDRSSELLAESRPRAKSSEVG